MKLTITPLGVLALRVWLEGEGKENSMTCAIFDCEQPAVERDPRPSRPGTFYYLCPEHLVVIQRQAVKDSLRGMEEQ